MGRLLAFVVIVPAMVIALGAFVVVVAAYVSERTEIVAQMVIVIGSAFGVASIGELIKGWAKKHEVSRDAT
jgi:hypothetical protein